MTIVEAMMGGAGYGMSDRSKSAIKGWETRKKSGGPAMVAGLKKRRKASERSSFMSFLKKRRGVSQ